MLCTGCLQVRRLNMYSKRAKRDKDGKLIHQEYQSAELPSTRIQPDRRWFGNTRVIGQKQLESFREQMSTKVGTLLLFRALQRRCFAASPGACRPSPSAGQRCGLRKS
jgi:NGP1NT (NUC091) domain